jgi:hypothetical protein
MLLNPRLFALSDPVWRAILTCLKEGELLMSELAARFDISLEAVSRHIQVWCALVWCTRSDPGVCRLDAGPIYAAAAWLKRYSAFWRQQSNLLATAILCPDDTKLTKRRRRRRDDERPDIVLSHDGRLEARQRLLAKEKESAARPIAR